MTKSDNACMEQFDRNKEGVCPRSHLPAKSVAEQRSTAFDSVRRAQVAHTAAKKQSSLDMLATASPYMHARYRCQSYKILSPGVSHSHRPGRHFRIFPYEHFPTRANQSNVAARLASFPAVSLLRTLARRGDATAHACIYSQAWPSS